MKYTKLLCLGLCLCLLLTLFVGCGEAEEPSGRYTLSAFSMEGVSYSLEELETLGADADTQLQFSNDHTGLLRFGDSEMPFTWDADTLTTGIDEIAYRFEEGKVILSYQGVEMTFEAQS